MIAAILRKSWVPTAMIALAAMSTQAKACSVCMGDVNSNVAGAANAAIFVMLGAIGSMLASLVAFGFYIYKRANAPIPPHIELVEEISQDGITPSHA